MIQHVVMWKFKKDTQEQMQAFLEGLKAVSYTHLDVYKRQVKRTENMNTLLLPAGGRDTAAIAAEILRRGGLVGLPTETVYGLCLLYTSRCV